MDSQQPSGRGCPFQAAFFSTLIFFASTACAKSESKYEPDTQIVPLSWESKGDQETKNWSTFVLDAIDVDFDTLNKAKDMNYFCPNYANLSRLESIHVWGMLISEVSYLESGWDPANRYLEGTMGIDPVTGKQVVSEGLLQLSYQDTLWMPICQFDWSKDKQLKDNDPHKTILDAYKNLHCGIKILARQINQRSAIVLSDGVYWSTLRAGSSKVQSIAGRVRKSLSFCATKKLSE